MAKNKKVVKIPERAKATLTILLQQKMLADLKFEAYIKGCFESMDLDGDWDLNTSEGTFTRQEKTQEATK